MADEPTFSVSHVPSVTSAVEALEKKACKLGIEKDFHADLISIYLKLQSDPLAWGEPEYHPKKTGSVVCHGIVGMLFVQFVVFEPERKVMVLKLLPLPNLPLAS